MSIRERPPPFAQVAFRGLLLMTGSRRRSTTSAHGASCGGAVLMESTPSRSEEARGGILTGAASGR